MDPTYVLIFTQINKSVTISHSSDGLINKNEFTFDRVFDINSSQIDVYNVAAKPIIDSVMDGFNGTVFAYGQTGSGKTFTMQGPDIEDLELQGIVPRMVRTVFNHIDNSSENIEFTVKVSMMEIYMEKIRDLLDPSKSNMQIKVDKTKGIYVGDLTERYISTDLDVYDIMRIGNDNRKVASTSMNDQSSRSHSIFVMTVHQTNLDDQTSKTGILYLVDLAGSEKVGKTGAKGHTLDEAKGINKSLSTLGKVINSLTDGKSKHVPYRESKLTRILSESLGGNAKTTLIITCSPSTYNDMETISTLRFGTAARNIKNKPKVNKELTVAEMKKALNKNLKIIQIKTYRIGILENCITDLGGEVPEDEYKDKSSTTSSSQSSTTEEEKDETNKQEEEEKEDKSEITNERIIELEEQLKRLRERLRIETDKCCELGDTNQVLQNNLHTIEDANVKLSFENQKLVEDSEEKNDIIETLNEKLKVMDEEIKNIVENNEKLSQKVLKYEELGGVYIDGELSEKEGKSKAKNLMKNELTKVSKLLKSKQAMLDAISKLPDLSEEIKKILEPEGDVSTQASETSKEELEDDALKVAVFNPSSELSLFRDKNH